MLFEIATSKKGLSVGLDLMGFLMMIPIIIALIRESRIKKPETKLLLYLMLCQAAVCFVDYHSWIFDGNSEYVGVLKMCDILSFSFAEVTLFAFMRYEIFMLRKRTYISEWVTYFVAFCCGTAVIIFAVGMLQSEPWFIGYNESGCAFYTSMYGIPYLFPLVVMLFGVILTWSCREYVSSAGLFALLTYYFFPFIGGIIDAFLYTSTIIPMMSLGLLVLYANIHIEVMRSEAVNEKELTKSKTRLMVSQIQPHFMYNSLNAIYYLIEKDPERAQEAVSTFSDYLRQNVNSLRNDAPVRFSEEIGHTEAYLYLEKLRFGDLLDIEFNIKADDFVIPALTIQPLVENAVKHGVTQKEEGGKVTISCNDCGKEYVITIVDDGVGFEAGEFKDDKAHSHVGIQNVKTRLETMVNGRLYVESTPGQGTSCTVVIPKEGQPK